MRNMLKSLTRTEGHLLSSTLRTSIDMDDLDSYGIEEKKEEGGGGGADGGIANGECRGVAKTRTRIV